MMNKLLKQIMSLYPAKLDEDIPDNDKEKAYAMGYNDAVGYVVDIFKMYYPDINPLGEGE